MKPALTVVLALALALALAAGAALPALAQDRADIDRTQIIGNRELPKVLYIVPWKKPLPGQLSGRPVQSVLDEALAPVDRQVFRRQVVYNTQVQSREAPAAAPSAQPGAAPTSTPAPAPTAPPATAPR
jgi:hypothetical protein